MFNATSRKAGVLFRTPYLTSTRGIQYKGRPRKTVSKFVQVQLLQDIPNVGVKGEIKSVKQGFMRNFLHINNKACYVNEDCPPRIPVVEPEQIVKEKLTTTKADEATLKQAEEAQAAADAAAAANEEPSAISLEELSSLFTSMKSKSGRNSSRHINNKSFDVEVTELKFDTLQTASGEFVAPGQETDDAKFDRIYEIADRLPKLITISEDKLPFGKDVVIDTIQKLAKEPIGSIEIAYADTQNEHLTTITEVGRYKVKLYAKDGESFVTQTLEVE